MSPVFIKIIAGHSESQRRNRDPTAGGSVTFPAKLLSMSSPFWGSGVKTADRTMNEPLERRGHALMKSRVS